MAVADADTDVGTTFRGKKWSGVEGPEGPRWITIRVRRGCGSGDSCANRKFVGLCAGGQTGSVAASGHHDPPSLATRALMKDEKAGEGT